MSATAKAPKMKIKTKDQVIVIAGRDKGKTGEVLRVIPKEQRLVVRGINLVKRHQRQTQTTEAGIIEKEATIHVSNVAHIDPKTKQPTRIGYKTLKDGAKVRIAKKSGEAIDKN